MEPKSIHTWFESDAVGMVGYSVDICISTFPENAPFKWLYSLALQINFTGHDEWAHGGLQWAEDKAYKESSNKGVNWGGGSDWAGYAGNGRTNTPFAWKVGNEYGYQVKRGEVDSNGLTHWHFSLVDYSTNRKMSCGIVKTKSVFIRRALVFTETGYGVQCDSPPIRVEWSNPMVECEEGQKSPHILKANYNGTCEGELTTNQGIISTSPLRWYHQTSCSRITGPNTVIWSAD
ncbi:MAG: hypothetical protein IPK32_02800 [Verrucomicrobiaceae bacterium]|nr:hypothetical protein [Verrucomicrobiaceae bacterium]